MRHDEIDALATRFFACIERGDVDTLRALYAPDATIWHNYDQLDQHVDDNLAVLGWLRRTVPDVRYVDVRRVVIDGGFVQQHLLTGTAPGGPLTMPAMMRVWTTDGRITRLEEYLDTAQLGPLRQASVPT